MLLHRPFEALTPTLDGDVLLVLARADASFTGGELARLVPHASPDGVRKAVKRLVAQGLVTMEQVGRAHNYRLNRRHVLADAVLSIARAGDLLRERVHEHVHGWPVRPEAVILFGSAARDEMQADSDIDLLVVAEREDEVEGAVADLSSAATAWTGNDTRVVQLHPQEVLEAMRAGDTLMGELLEDGQTLWGPTRYLQRIWREVTA